MAKVVLKNLSKHFGEVRAVDGIDLEVRDKEFLTLLGPSGCGKTTTLRLIAGLEDLDDGEIYIGDEIVNDLSPKERDIAMVFQSYALYPHMNVLNNIAFGLKMHKVPKREIEKRVRETAELLKIEELLSRKPKQLSGGQQQRVALGRAIAREPKVFLLDEPLSNLDAKLRTYMRGELKRLQKEIETTTIYVTHDQAEAMTMSDRVAVMSGGKVKQVDAPHLIYKKPAGLFVAGFVGSPTMNFIDISLEEKDGRLSYNTEGFSLNFSTRLKQVIRDRATSSELVLGIRPEDIRICRKKEPNSIEAKIYVVEPMGSYKFVRVQVGRSLIVIQTPSEFSADMGDKVEMTFDEDKIHIFDKKKENLVV